MDTSSDTQPTNSNESRPLPPKKPIGNVHVRTNSDQSAPKKVAKFPPKGLKKTPNVGPRNLPQVPKRSVSLLNNDNSITSNGEEKKQQVKTFRSTVNLSDSSLLSLENMVKDDADVSLSISEYIEKAFSNSLFQKVEVKCVEKRDNNANEFLTTEQSYLKSLIVLNEVYRRPMINASKKEEIPLSLDEVDAIFSKYFTQILKVNLTLLKGLVERLENWSPTQLLGDLLLDLMPFLKMYTNYTGGWEKAISILDEYESKESFNNFIQQCIAQYPNAQPIRSYLIMPIQRIPRYRLLLEDLIKHTDKSHPDYESLSSSLNKVMHVANQVDQAINEQKNRAKLLQVQKKFLENVPIFEAGRVFIKEGELTKICRKDNKKFMFFLFNDMLMYAKEMPGGRYTRNRIYPLNSILIKDLPDEPNKKVVNAFQVNSNKKSFVVLANSPEEKNAWVKELNKCIEDIDEKMKTFHDKKTREVSTFAPVWVPDSECPTCIICGVKFTFIERKHHCRQCGKVVCGKCSTKKKHIPGKEKKKRVCDLCFDKPFPDSSVILSENSNTPTNSTPNSLKIEKDSQESNSSSTSNSSTAPSSTTEIYTVCSRNFHPVLYWLYQELYEKVCHRDCIKAIDLLTSTIISF